MCLQETKVGRKDLDQDVAIAPGYQTFYTSGQHKNNYAGVMSLARDELATSIVGVSEGLTGVLDGRAGSGGGGGAGGGGGRAGGGRGGGAVGGDRGPL